MLGVGEGVVEAQVVGEPVASKGEGVSAGDAVTDALPPLPGELEGEVLGQGVGEGILEGDSDAELECVGEVRVVEEGDRLVEGVEEMVPFPNVVAVGGAFVGVVRALPLVATELVKVSVFVGETEELREPPKAKSVVTLGKDEAVEHSVAVAHEVG